MIHVVKKIPTTYCHLNAIWTYSTGYSDQTAICWMLVTTTIACLAKASPFISLLPKFSVVYRWVEPTMCRSNGFHSLRIQSPCHRMIGVYNHLLSNVYRFHYHSQKVIGSLGIHIPNKIQLNLFKCVGQFLLLILDRNNYKKQLAYSIYQKGKRIQTIQKQILWETKLSLMVSSNPPTLLLSR